MTLIEQLEALKEEYCPLGAYDKNWRYANGTNDAIAKIHAFIADLQSEEMVEEVATAIRNRKANGIGVTTGDVEDARAAIAVVLGKLTTTKGN